MLHCCTLNLKVWIARLRSVDARSVEALSGRLRRHQRHANLRVRHDPPTCSRTTTTDPALHTLHLKDATALSSTSQPKPEEDGFYPARKGLGWTAPRFGLTMLRYFQRSSCSPGSSATPSKMSIHVNSQPPPGPLPSQPTPGPENASHHQTKNTFAASKGTDHAQKGRAWRQACAWAETLNQRLQ